MALIEENRIELDHELSEEVMRQLDFLTHIELDGPRYRIVDSRLLVTSSMNNVFSNIQRLLTTGKTTTVQKEVEDYETIRGDYPREFIDEIKSIFDMDRNMSILGHGTPHKDNAESIMKNGLRASDYDVFSSFIPMSFTQGTFDTISAWPHKESKYIVVVGTKDHHYTPFWKTIGNGVYGDNYECNPNRVIGYIDVENNQLIRNSNYNPEVEYNQEYDTPLVHFSTLRDLSASKEEQEIFERYSIIGRMLSLAEGQYNGKVPLSVFKTISAQTTESMTRISSILETIGITEEEVKPYHEEPVSTLTYTQSIADLSPLDLEWDDTPDQKPSFKNTGQESIETTTGKEALK